MIKKLTGLTASLAALASTVSAEVKINDYLSLDGYVILAGTITDPEGGSSTDTLADSGASNLDAARIALIGKYNDFSGKVSLFYVPNRAGTEAGVLDAYATYSTGAISVTGGKFLSYLGYEAFEPVNMAQLTYGFASGIPAYSTGAKIDYAGESFTLGFSVQDSLQPEAGTFYQGDGDWSDGLGYTLAATYTGINKLTLFAGVGYDDDDAAGTAGGPSEWVYDVWASYAVTDKLTLAAEVSHADDASTSYIVLANYAFTEKFSSVFRWSWQEVEPTDEYSTYLTVAPTYVFTENFSVRAEVSYLDQPSTMFYGIQGVFKF